MEANAEVRFPIRGTFEGVAFTDVGQVWADGDGIQVNEFEVTPGIGFRFPSPVGPIRVDLAYRARREESLTLVVPSLEAYDPMRHAPADQIRIDGASFPFVATGDLALLDTPARLRSLGSRLQLHLSIGQAF